MNEFEDVLNRCIQDAQRQGIYAAVGWISPHTLDQPIADAKEWLLTAYHNAIHRIVELQALVDEEGL